MVEYRINLLKRIIQLIYLSRIPKQY